MLMPKKTKFRKSHKPSRGGKATRLVKISFGNFALKSIGAHWVSSRQIEAARRVMSRFTKRGGKIWIRVFPDKPIAKKPPETRMGSGKAPTDHYAAVIKPGKVLFEMSGVTDEIARRALGKAAAKLPLRTKFIIKA